MHSGKLGLSQRGGNPFNVTTHSFTHANSNTTRKPVRQTHSNKFDKIYFQLFQNLDFVLFFVLFSEIANHTMIGFGGPSQGPSGKSKLRYGGGYGGYQSKSKATKY